jgi:vacuolar-type H+-ATPase subunit F/Vma7
MEYRLTGCVTITAEDSETALTRANRLILQLQAAAIAVDELIIEAIGDDAERFDEVCMLRSAILAAENCLPSSQPRGCGTHPRKTF